MKSLNPIGYCFVLLLIMLLSSCAKDVWVTEEIWFKNSSFSTSPDKYDCREQLTTKDFLSTGFKDDPTQPKNVTEGKNCISFGYEDNGGMIGDAKLYNGPNGGLLPGPNGYFASNLNNTGGGGGGGANCDISNYNGPEFDIQADSQCKSAYLYKCQGNFVAVQTTCDLYYSFESLWTGPGPYPRCPYCD